MRIICISNENYKLTVGKAYEAEESSRDFYRLINDANVGVRYHKRLFEVEENEEVPVAPEPEPEPVRTEQDLIDSIRVENGLVRFTDVDNQDVIIRNRFGCTDSTISCGVKQYSGINDTLQEIDRQFNLEEGDFLDIRKALFKACIEAYCTRGTFKLFSTNVEGVDHGFVMEEDFVSVLDNLAKVVTPSEVNENSGRRIKVWVL